MKFISNIKDRLVHILSCCNKDKEPMRDIEIGHPTDFRRIDINIPGLTEQQQMFLRVKAATEVDRIYAGLPASPMPSSAMPQGSFDATTTSVNDPKTTELSSLVHLPNPRSPSTINHLMKHARRASQRLSLGWFDMEHSPYGPVHASIMDDEKAVCLSEVDVSWRQSYDSKGFEDRKVAAEWSGRDSVTLEGSDGCDGEKGLIKA